MAQSAVTVRIDSELKTQFDALCEQFGMSANTAFNMSQHPLRHQGFAKCAGIVYAAKKCCRIEQRAGTLAG